MRDHGTLVQITADSGMMLDLARTSLGFVGVAASTPLVPGGGGGGASTPGTDAGGVLGSAEPGTTTTPGSPGTSDPGEVLRENASGSAPGGSDPGGAAGSSGGGSGGGDGRLPFTGFAVIAVAAVGAAATGAGVTLRRVLRRGD